MLIKAADLVAKLFSADEMAVLDALRMIRSQNATSLPYVIDAILRPGDNACRPIFFNLTAEVDTWVVGEANLKLIAIRIKQRTELKRALSLICNLSDSQLYTLAEFVKDAQETVREDSLVEKPYTKPYIPSAISWKEQRQLMLGGNR
jgi:hypothetical protein